MEKNRQHLIIVVLAGAWTPSTQHLALKLRVLEPIIDTVSCLDRAEAVKRRGLLRGCAEASSLSGKGKTWVNDGVCAPLL